MNRLSQCLDYGCLPNLTLLLADLTTYSQYVGMLIQ